MSCVLRQMCLVKAVVVKGGDQEDAGSVTGGDFSFTCDRDTSSVTASLNALGWKEP